MNKWFACVLCLILACVGQPVAAQRDFLIERSCPVPHREPTLPEETTLSGYSQAILDFFSDGGQPSDLDKILIARRLAQPHMREAYLPITPFYLNRGGVRVADFNGDGYLDVAVSLHDPERGYAGALFVYICDGQHFRQIPSPLLSAIDPSTHEPVYVDRAPKFVYVGDMNNDGRAELVVDTGVEGASTIWTQVEIFGWSDQTQDMRPLNLDQDSYPADNGYAKVVNGTNGFKVLVVRTGFSGSGIASGPQRQFTLTNTWNGKHFVITDAVGDPSINRLHIAYDALVALNHGNLSTAILLYSAVLKNKNLEDWDNDPDIRNLLLAHAAYGLVLAHARQSGPQSILAIEAYRQLQQLADQLGEKDFLWFKYADLFWHVAETTKDLHRACQSVNETIQADVKALPSRGPGGIRQLGIWPWFTYNINWIPTDRGLSFCPL